MDPIPFYVAGLAPEAEGALLTSLEDLPLRHVPDSARAAGDAPSAGVAVVALNGDPEAAFRIVSTLATGGTRVAVVGAAKDPDVILRAMRAGAREFVVAGEAERLERAVRQLVQPVTGAAACTVTAFFGAKGGVGATTLAANVAANVAARGARTCVVDLDLQLGDLLSVLDLQGTYTISDVLVNVRRLDRDLLDSSVPKHRAGMHVLSQGDRIEEAEKIDGASITQLVAFLRQHYDHVVLDGLRGFDELALAALDVVDRVVLPVTQEVPAVRSVQRSVEILRKLGYDERKLVLVVNRFHPRASVTREVIAETIGLPLAATVANDYGLLEKIVNHGGTVVEAKTRAPLVRDVDALTTLLAGELGVAPRPTGWRRFLGGGRNGAR